MGPSALGQRMKRTVVVFQRPFQIGVEQEDLPPPGAGEVAVQACASAISTGTEMLCYRGRIPGDLPLDATLSALSGAAGYPLRYGYAAVGQVTGVGAQAPDRLLGRRVFCFHPHASHFCAHAIDAVPIPDDIDDRDALFLAGMETAVTLMLDGRPMIGETAAILGQGVVGLLATALLARHPLRRLVTVDPIPRRREASLEMGAHVAMDPAEVDAIASPPGSQAAAAAADLAFELSGDPSALNAAIALTGFGGRIVLGSWYGTAPAALHLGGRFHRSRIRLISSQVSTLPTHVLARWDRERRQQTAWEMIRLTRPSRLITHTVPVARAAEAYDLLDRRPEKTLQVVLAY
jgi:2-desacetyl-2-hydroxyethyl bacteriochlorophyllide A dehydrogenase